ARVGGAAQVRHGEARAVELAGEVDRDASVPLRRIDLVYLSRGACDARIVHEAVEPAQRGDPLREEALDLGAHGDVAPGRGEGRIARAERLYRRRVRVAHVHARALPREGPRDLPPDPRG